VSENFGEFQVREVKFLKIPDYFPALKDSIVHAGFLGSEIVAKVRILDEREQKGYGRRGWVILTCLPLCLHS
jgi:hypothetical protein